MTTFVAYFLCSGVSKRQIEWFPLETARADSYLHQGGTIVPGGLEDFVKLMFVDNDGAWVGRPCRSRYAADYGNIFTRALDTAEAAVVFADDAVPPPTLLTPEQSLSAGVAYLAYTILGTASMHSQRYFLNASERYLLNAFHRLERSGHRRDRLHASMAMTALSYVEVWSRNFGPAANYIKRAIEYAPSTPCFYRANLESCLIADLYRSGAVSEARHRLNLFLNEDERFRSWGFRAQMFEARVDIERGKRPFTNRDW